jgi:glutamate racemase
VIGIITSSKGGSYLAKQLKAKFPQANFAVYWDNLHQNYNLLPEANLAELLVEASEKLQKEGSKLIVTDFLLTKELINSALSKALGQSRFGNIAILGDFRDQLKGLIKEEFGKLAANCWQPSEKKALAQPRLIFKSAGILPLLSEYNLTRKPEAKMQVRKILLPLKHAHTDTLILADARLDILAKTIARKMGKNCQVIDFAKIVAELIKKNETTVEAGPLANPTGKIQLTLASEDAELRKTN